MSWEILYTSCVIEFSKGFIVYKTSFLLNGQRRKNPTEFDLVNGLHKILVTR